MKVLQKSFGETRCRVVQTIPVRLNEPPMEPRAYVELGPGKHSVLIRTSRRTQIAIPA